MQIGLLTIGQAPRADVVPEMQAILGPQVTVLEAGALDGLTLEEIKALAPGPGDYVLATRLRDGTEVLVAREQIVPRLEQRIQELEARGVRVIGLLCTGSFPRLASRVPLLKPEPLLHALVQSLAGRGAVGVLTPSPAQRLQTQKKWQAMGVEAVVVAASPYGAPAALEQAGEALRAAGVTLVVLDCIGYTAAMKARLKAITGVPVLLAHALLARLLHELL
ncbi:MAG: hypothetical protein KatS3mg131_2119 [Candidatus Tectimicrobiota bacterium]|nr:MAG: hypothetical protein KatS3mg131_2119 [Candidatus Tectomicrobia bacterium]